MKLLKLCIPAAALIGASVYTAEDKKVLGDIGLEMRNGQLVQVGTGRPPPRAFSARRPTIRQGGPQCYDILLWGDDGPLPAEPAYREASPAPVGMIPLAASQPPFIYGEYRENVARQISIMDAPFNPVITSNQPVINQPVSVDEPDMLNVLAIAALGWLSMMLVVRKKEV